MKRFFVVFYGGLYTFIAVSLATLEYASVKIGWPWLSTLVLPMGLVFLAVNVPLATIAVIKIGHVVYLHSVTHHTNVMRTIRQKDSFTSLPTSPKQQFHIEDGTAGHRPGTGGTLLDAVPQNSPPSQTVPHGASTPDDFNVTVAYYLSQYPGASIREVERATGIPKSSIGRTNAWKNRS